MFNIFSALFHLAQPLYCMGGGGSAPTVDYSAQKASSDAETARLKAERDLVTQKADQQVMADKLSQAAKEATDFKSRQTLLAKAGLGDTEEDPLNPSTRKKNTGSLLSALSDQPS